MLQRLGANICSSLHSSVFDFRRALWPRARDLFASGSHAARARQAIRAALSDNMDVKSEDVLSAE